MPSDDDFQVMVMNNTYNALNPKSNTLEWGEFNDGGDPADIGANTQNAEQAFWVIGKIASGPQGSVLYNVDNNTLMNVQFNSNVGGNSNITFGDYFYVGLQPAATGDDPTGYYVQISGFTIPTAVGTTSFSPTVTLYGNEGGSYNVTALSSANPQGFGVVYLIYIVNNTDDLITLNTLNAPLNCMVYDYPAEGTYQPALAATIVPQSEPQLLLTMLYGLGYQSIASLDVSAMKLNTVYNLANGTLITFTYDWQTGTQVGVTFSGVNSSSYTFDSPSVTSSSSDNIWTIQTTITIGTT